MGSFDWNRVVGMLSDIMSWRFIQSPMSLITCGIARHTEGLITEAIERIRNYSKFFGVRPSAFSPMCYSSSETVDSYVADRWSTKEDQALCLSLEIQVVLQWPVWHCECTDGFTGTQKKSFTCDREHKLGLVRTTTGEWLCWVRKKQF